MIDIENYILTQIKNSLAVSYPDAVVQTDFLNVPGKFPCVTVSEDDNATYTESQDTALTEHHARVMYAINVFSDKQTGAKTEAKTILDLVDVIMQNMKFTRVSMLPTPNVDPTVYRVTARYSAIVEEGMDDGTNIVHQMYRR